MAWPNLLKQLLHNGQLYVGVWVEGFLPFVSMKFIHSTPGIFRKNYLHSRYICCLATSSQMEIKLLQLLPKKVSSVQLPSICDRNILSSHTFNKWLVPDIISLFYPLVLSQSGENNGSPVLYLKKNISKAVHPAVIFSNLQTTANQN